LIQNQLSLKQGVAITGRNRTVPPCNVRRRTGHAADRSRALQTTPTDDSVQNNASLLGGPLINATM